MERVLSSVQIDAWRGDFGRQYTRRNPHSLTALDALYEEQFGISRSALNQEFLGDLDR